LRAIQQTRFSATNSWYCAT